jgi:ATP-dependent helicase HrpB
MRILRRWPWSWPAGAPSMPTALAWLDPPPAAPLAQARDLLQQLGAIECLGAHHCAWPPNSRRSACTRDLGAHADQVEGHRRRESRLRSRRVLSERDILRANAGARDADIAAARCRDARRSTGFDPGISVDERAFAGQAQRRNWRRDLYPRRARLAPIRTERRAFCWRGRIRIASARRGDGGRYLLANGRGARFREPQAMAKAEFIVAAELDGAEREARIFLAAPISAACARPAFCRR